MARKPALQLVNEKTNGAKETIERTAPYTFTVTIEGSSDLLFHRWNCEAIKEKSDPNSKGSSKRKIDDVETYVWRTETGELAIPGEYVRQSIINAARYQSDPRSPRKSAMDLYKAGIVALTNLAPLGVKEWDYLDTRRAVVQRQGINRVRPAMRVGWQATFEFMVNSPEYIDRQRIRDTIEQAGRLIGIGDFKPTFGRFGIVRFI